MQPANSNDQTPTEQRQYKWPWVVLAAFMLAVVLAVMWMTREIQRTKRIRDANPPKAAEQSVSPISSASEKAAA